MPRHARLDAPDTIHHVIGRGIAGIKVFPTKKDRSDFLLRVAERCEAGALMVYAWALLDTHFHLLVRTGSDTISSSMRKVLTGYAVNFNRRHRRYGHLFQNRFKSIVCEEDPYLLELTRYIHLNPLRAGVVKDMNELDVYPWTGHAVIMGKERRPWQDRDAILALFGKVEGQAKTRYRQFVEDGLTMGKRADFTGGGLIRSQGGWAEVASMRRRQEPAAFDDRILGSGTFVGTVLAEAEEKKNDGLRLRAAIPDLAALAQRIAQKEGISLSDLLSGARRRKVAQARRLLCQIAVKRLFYTGASVARFLGVSTSLVNRMANMEAADLESYLESSLCTNVP
jgi:REP element-mobilizing transposase RayT